MVPIFGAAYAGLKFCRVQMLPETRYYLFWPCLCMRRYVTFLLSLNCVGGVGTGKVHIIAIHLDFPLQKKYTVRTSYLEGQEITGKMRAILIDWLCQVHHRFHLLQETLYLTVAIIDRFLQVNVYTCVLNFSQFHTNGKLWISKACICFHKIRKSTSRSNWHYK